MMKRFAQIFLKCFLVLFAALVLVFSATGLSPIYRFGEPRPFEGPDIFDPYAHDCSACGEVCLDTAGCGKTQAWTRANLHTHTIVKGIFNECHHTPREVYDTLAGFGYGIVTFSNHNRLTVQPFDSCLQVNLYEHGYNLCKYHKNVFGCKVVCHFDHLLPVLASQRQFQMDMLLKDCDFIQLNHPARTNFTTASHMRKLSGYRLIELDSGKTTEQDYWDEALSAGHYSFGTANDDLHFPDISWKTAVRCNFINTPSARYEDLKEALLGGDFYSMRVPDYGGGDWRKKHEMNAQLPEIQEIGLRGECIVLRLSVPADSIKVKGQGGATLAIANGTDSLRYHFRDCDSYARVTAYFADGCVIYTNPFARYDKRISDSPFREASHSISWPLTILYNLGLLLIVIICIYLIIKILKKKS